MSNEMKVVIRPVEPTDKGAWARLRRKLFPDFDPPEIDEFFETGCFDGFDKCAVFVAEAEGRLVGFAEASARPYAEGCTTTPVTYLEAWYVDEEARILGVGRCLVDAVADWGRSKGMREFASDAEINNLTSHSAHGAVGFEEVERIVCFAKSL